MKLHVALLIGLVVLGGCLGGAGGVFGDGSQGETTARETTEAPDAAATESAAAEQTTTPAAERTTTSAAERTTTPAAAADCGRQTEGETGSTVGETGESEANAETTTPPATSDPDENVTATFVVEDCEDVTVTLMVADEPDERQRGLMHRQSLPDRTGMVFVYDDAAPRTFWMKNTYVPLDIVFVAPDGTVLNVEHAQAQPHAPDSEVDRYSSEGDATYVVELERGFANRTGVGPGSELVFNDSAPEAGPGTVSATG